MYAWQGFFMLNDVRADCSWLLRDIVVQKISRACSRSYKDRTIEMAQTVSHSLRIFAFFSLYMNLVVRYRVVSQSRQLERRESEIQYIQITQISRPVAPRAEFIVAWGLFPSQSACCCQALGLCPYLGHDSTCESDHHRKLSHSSLCCWAAQLVAVSDHSAFVEDSWCT